MIRLMSVADLHVAWGAIAAALERDPIMGARFVEAPIQTLRNLGFTLGPAALATLRAALP